MSDDLFDDSFSTKQLRRMFDTNFFGLMDVTTAALPYLRKSKDGRMVVFGSRTAWTGEMPVSAKFNSQFMFHILRNLISMLTKI